MKLFCKRFSFSCKELCNFVKKTLHSNIIMAISNYKISIKCLICATRNFIFALTGKCGCYNAVVVCECNVGAHRLLVKSR